MLRSLQLVRLSMRSQELTTELSDRLSKAFIE